MKPFDLLEPEALADALVLLESADDATRPAGGGTALMLMMKAGVLEPARLVSLRRIAAAHSAITATDDAVEIGALATLAAIERSVVVAKRLPVLTRTLRTLANVRVRNVATLGGHLAHADPHMDLPPVLVALGASVIVASRAGERAIAVADLITGYYETSLASGELIVKVRIPTRLAHWAAYRKVSTRSADDWPALGVAVALERDGATVREARIAASAAFDRPVRFHAAEALFRGVVDEPLIARIGEEAAAEAQPVADQHGSSAYKRELIRVHVARAAREAMRAGGATS